MNWRDLECQTINPCICNSLYRHLFLINHYCLFVLRVLDGSVTRRESMTTVNVKKGSKGGRKGEECGGGGRDWVVWMMWRCMVLTSRGMAVGAVWQSLKDKKKRRTLAHRCMNYVKMNYDKMNYDTMNMTPCIMTPWIWHHELWHHELWHHELWHH